MNPNQTPAELDTILWQFATYMKRMMGGRQVGGSQLDHDQAKAALEQLFNQHLTARLQTVLDRITAYDPTTNLHERYCHMHEVIKSERAAIQAQMPGEGK